MSPLITVRDVSDTPSVATCLSGNVTDELNIRDVPRWENLTTPKVLRLSCCDVADPRGRGWNVEASYIFGRG